MAEKILVVDDEPLIQTTIRRALERRGYDVRTTGDAESFLAELERERADLLIMDVNLGGISSETLMDRVYALAPGVRVLFISGVMPKLEVDHFLEKPFLLDDLRRMVREILDGRI